MLLAKNNANCILAKWELLKERVNAVCIAVAHEQGVQARVKELQAYCLAKDLRAAGLSGLSTTEPRLRFPACPSLSDGGLYS